MSQDPVVSAFDRSVRRASAAPVILSPHGRYTFGDVDAVARLMTRRIESAGLRSGAVVGLRSPNGLGFLAAFVACLRVGCVPILIDHRLSELEVRGVLERLDAQALLCCPAWPSRAEDLEIAPSRSDRSRDGGLAAAQSVIKLTSGSTGSPRGILTSTEALLADDEALFRSMEVRDGDRMLATVPFSHSYGLSVLAVRALVHRTPLVVPDRAGVFAPLDAARDFEATVFPTVPAYLAALMRVRDAPPLVDSLRRIITAGARILPGVAAAVRERYGRCVHAFYGASECGGIAYDPEGTAAERETIGPPVEGVRIDIRRVDGVDDDGVGRIVVSSSAVATRYLPDADERLGDGVFVTDDIGCRRDAELVLLGRLNDLIHVRGSKVNPVEIERVICAMPAVEEAKVVGVVDEESGDQSVVALIVCRPGVVSAEEIRAWCRARLSSFKTPRSFVFLERMPRDGRGKINRVKLARLAASMRADRTRC